MAMSPSLSISKGVSRNTSNTLMTRFIKLYENILSEQLLQADDNFEDDLTFRF